MTAATRVTTDCYSLQCENGSSAWHVVSLFLSVCRRTSWKTYYTVLDYYWILFKVSINVILYFWPKHIYNTLLSIDIYIYICILECEFGLKNWSAIRTPYLQILRSRLQSSDPAYNPASPPTIQRARLRSSEPAYDPASPSTIQWSRLQSSEPAYNPASPPTIQRALPHIVIYTRCLANLVLKCYVFMICYACYQLC